MASKPVSSNAKRSDNQPFLTDVKMLRERARQHIAGGAVTEGYGGDTETAVKVLNTALATEIICVLRYKRHYFMARGIHSGQSLQSFSSTPARSRNTPTVSRSASSNSAAHRISLPIAFRRVATPSTSKGIRWST